MYEVGVGLLSRSEARRIMLGLEKFRDIELDFAGVKTVGQSFADEIFRVFKKQHPHIRLLWVYTNKDVEKIIQKMPWFLIGTRAIFLGLDQHTLADG